MSLVLLDVPCPDRETAMRIAKTLVEERLIACGNVVDGVTSVYRWEGTVETSSEVLLLAKTTAEKVDAAADRAEELHPYDVPCVGRIAMTANEAYERWVLEVVGQAPPDGFRASPSTENTSGGA